MKRWENGEVKKWRNESIGEEIDRWKDRLIKRLMKRQR